MLDAQKVSELRHVISETPGEFSFWPTHFAGTIPFVEVYDENLRLTFEVARKDAKPSEYDQAIKYARRLAACANEMPGLLDELERLQKENAELRQSRDEVSAFLLSYWRGELPSVTIRLNDIEAALHRAGVKTTKAQ